MKDCAFYGDSLSDKPVMEAAGFPHCVNPRSQELKDAAALNAWPVLAWST